MSFQQRTADHTYCAYRPPETDTCLMCDTVYVRYGKHESSETSVPCSDQTRAQKYHTDVDHSLWWCKRFLISSDIWNCRGHCVQIIRKTYRTRKMTVEKHIVTYVQ
ncbi:uncharacterized protein LOC112691602 [Sipha flava]|uniref:Uncharacterized protein LOC112691602 n=1 Tax=Sipha flava TaxID=143950 RepID=A0A2S2R4N5_9HEMI|nr:uncharacterized protein LOC112691602 [Sipha flava]XP_025421698.1 uncharacterized protein LOC112691602 [Sipha flava]XP_025421699.1 uncharacterized protein LOC112691602 [Sipha flava]